MGQRQKASQTSKKITDAVYLTRAPRKPSKILQFDPRPPAFCDATLDATLDKNDLNSFVVDLQLCGDGIQTSMWEILLQHDNYNLTFSEIVLLKTKCSQLVDSLRVSG